MTVVRAGVPHVVFETLDSTNEEARRRAEAGDLGPTWLMARSQTAGRGRRGRRWESPAGALFATYLGTTSLPPQRLALLSFAAAVAVAETLETIGCTNARLKWPNDVLLPAGKIAGILLESSPMRPGKAWFALGIGVNLHAAPQGLNQPTAGAAAAVSPEAFLDLAGPRIASWSAFLEEGTFAPLREAWLARAYGLGQQVTTQQAGKELTGTFADLDPDGALLLDTGEQTMRITAGEVHFPAQP